MMRLLALVPGGIGDQLLFFPTLETLKQTYPQAAIDVVVEPRSVGAYRVCPYVNNIWKFDFKGSNSFADWGNLLGTIRDCEYDVVLSLGKSFSVGLLLWLTGIPERIAFSGAGSFLLTQPVPLEQNQYAAAMYHDLASKGLGIDQPCPPIKLAIPQGDVAWVKSELKRMGIEGKGYVLIHGGASELSQRKGINKIYPVESWKTIINGVQAKLYDAPLVVIGGPDDRKLIKALTELQPQLKVINPPDIGKLAALIMSAQLLLCTDSAPMHIGVATGIKLVALFGPTEPAKLLPSNDQIKAIQSAEGQPIGAIAPDDVLAAI
ncbi:glycosyl transferase family 9 [Thalassoporum mexicanum PCC 7367]|uniref:glycosyltransferase family 9 protein n=1 Tax=Thalassoporum mexicanum TaxID=3457544 RepID=UPI00029FA370|nr:glycosyltransferase family 9 protein [Pseudanabaena sp. PCC 7367]AFY69404.1 glycosyl transferase family 9 [Pseudanabaena sp. PCC 7367]